MITIIDTMNDPKLFKPWFAARWLRKDSWFAHKVFLKSLYGLPMNAEELALYRQHTHRIAAPTVPFKKAFNVKGRRAGGSRIGALIATYSAVFKEYPELQRGETGVVAIIATDRAQANVLFDYVCNFFHDVPLLRKMVANETKDSLELSNDIRIEIMTSDHRSVRGRTFVCGIFDELAFWPSDANSVSPDSEIVDAVEKGSANIPAAMLVGISSPYSRRGLLWEAYEKNFGKETDELVWVGDSRSMNPTLSQKIIDRAYMKDPQAASAEFGAIFRSDLETFLTLEAIRGCVIAGRIELPPCATKSYYGFCDPSGGSADAFTLAVAHEERGVAVLDMLREVVPPFSPENVVAEFAQELKRYRISTVTGDAYAGEWPREQFAKRGVEYCVSERTRSEIYLELLPLLNSKQCVLLDDAKLIAQLVGLERRTARSGKDSVDHRPSSHDDLCNSAAGAVVLVAAGGGILGMVEFLKGVSDGTIKLDADPMARYNAPPSPQAVASTETRECTCGGVMRAHPLDRLKFTCQSCGRCVLESAIVQRGQSRGAYNADEDRRHSVSGRGPFGRFGS